MNTTIIAALILFIITYILMFSLQKLRPVIAVAAAVVFVAAGSTGLLPDFRFGIAEALDAIDWNVIMMISGTMGLVYLFINSRMPDLMSDIIVSKVGSVRLLVLALSLFAGIISAFVDNVATVLMIAPVALAVCRSLNISPVPAIICISISSNLQGAATLVGDTTSILLARQAGMDFMDFFFIKGRPGMFWVTEAGAVVTAFIILWLFRGSRAEIKVEKSARVEDYIPTVLLAAAIISLIAASFIPYKENALPGQLYKPDITNGLICLMFFIFGIIHQVRRDRHFRTVMRAIREIDYYTLVLLIGLFVIIGGIEKAGLIDFIGTLLASLSGSGSRMSVFVVYSVIVWMSVLLSAFIDNIPYTATMLPVVAVVAGKLSEAGGVYIDPNLFYFGLMVGATLGGNITPIGASANITGIGILRKGGYEVSTAEFMNYSVPFTLAAVTTGYILLWQIWM